MEQKSSFKIDGYILRSVLNNLNTRIHNYTQIRLSKYNVEFYKSGLYIKIPSTILKEYVVDTNVSNLSTYSNFEYLTELPKKHGTEVYMEFIKTGNIFKSEIKCNGLVLNSTMSISTTLTEFPNLEHTNNTITIHSMNIPTIVHTIKKPVTLYLGCVGDEIRIGSSVNSYISFIESHNGDDVHFYISKDRRKMLSKLNIKDADSLIIDIDTVNSNTIFKWIVDKVVYMMNMYVNIQV